MRLIILIFFISTITTNTSIIHLLSLLLLFLQLLRITITSNTRAFANIKISGINILPNIITISPLQATPCLLTGAKHRAVVVDGRLLWQYDVGYLAASAHV